MSVDNWVVAIIGGAGAMGRLLGAVLQQAGATVELVDTVPSEGILADDIVNPSDVLIDLLGRADVVILCTPDSVTFDNLAATAARCAAGSLLVDTSSAKHRLLSLVAGDIPESVEYVSLNPLFAPGLGFDAQNVIAVPVREGERGETLLRFMETLGARVTKLSIDAHERSMAAAQVATHAALLAYGGALERFGYVVTEGLPLSTPPQRTLLAMLARIASGSPHVYHDIQVGNGYGHTMRDALAASLNDVYRTIDDHHAFEALMARSQAFLGDELPALTALCKRLYKG